MSLTAAHCKVLSVEANLLRHREPRQYLLQRLQFLKLDSKNPEENNLSALPRIEVLGETILVITQDRVVLKAVYSKKIFESTSSMCLQLIAGLVQIIWLQFLPLVDDKDHPAHFDMTNRTTHHMK